MSYPLIPGSTTVVVRTPSVLRVVSPATGDDAAKYLARRLNRSQAVAFTGALSSPHLDAFFQELYGRHFRFVPRSSGLTAEYVRDHFRPGRTLAPLSMWQTELTVVITALLRVGGVEPQPPRVVEAVAHDMFVSFEDIVEEVFRAELEARVAAVLTPPAEGTEAAQLARITNVRHQMRLAITAAVQSADDLQVLPSAVSHLLVNGGFPYVRWLTHVAGVAHVWQVLTEAIASPAPMTADESTIARAFAAWDSVGRLRGMRIMNVKEYAGLFDIVEGATTHPAASPAASAGMRAFRLRYAPMTTRIAAGIGGLRGTGASARYAIHPDPAIEAVATPLLAAQWYKFDTDEMLHTTAQYGLTVSVLGHVYAFEHMYRAPATGLTTFAGLPVTDTPLAPLAGPMPPAGLVIDLVYAYALAAAFADSILIDPAYVPTPEDMEEYLPRLFAYVQFTFRQASHRLPIGGTLGRATTTSSPWQVLRTADLGMNVGTSTTGAGLAQGRTRLYDGPDDTWFHVDGGPMDLDSERAVRFEIATPLSLHRSVFDVSLGRDLLHRTHLVVVEDMSVSRHILEHTQWIRCAWAVIAPVSHDQLALRLISAIPLDIVKRAPALLQLARARGAPMPPGLTTLRGPYFTLTVGKTAVCLAQLFVLAAGGWRAPGLASRSGAGATATTRQLAAARLLFDIILYNLPLGYFETVAMRIENVFDYAH